jgi:hypothetical protein
MLDIKETGNGCLGDNVKIFEVTGSPISRFLSLEETYDFYTLQTKLSSVRSRYDYLVFLGHVKTILEKSSLVREISSNE